MRAMKHFSRTLSILGVAAGCAALMSGCSFFQAPEPEPLPAPVAQPEPDFFNPNDYNVKGVELNKAGDPQLPDYFEVTSFEAPDILMVRSVKVSRVGDEEQLSYGAPDRVRLAGIYTPRPDSSNDEERRYAPMAMQTVRNWTLGRKLNIEQDSRFPLDLQSIRRVQVFFPGGEGGTQMLNLNRMLVRSGYAVVDIQSPTIFDTKGWLNDEEYARSHRLGLWPYIVMQSRQQPPLRIETEETETQETSAPEEALE